MKFTHLSRQFLVVFVIVVAITIGLSGWAVTSVAQQIIVNNITQQHLELARRIADEIETRQEDILPVLSNLAKSEEVRSMNADGVLEALQLVKDNFQTISELYIASPAGQQLVRTDGQPLEDIAPVLGFQVAIQGKELISDVYLSQDGHAPTRTIYIPIYKDNAQSQTQNPVIGVLVADIDFAWVQATLENLTLIHNETAVVFASNGQVIAHSQLDEIGEHPALTDLVLLETLVRGQPGIQDNYIDELGRSVIGSHAPVEGYGWGVVIQSPINDLIKETAVLNKVMVWGLFGSLLLAIFAGWWMSNYLAKPIAHLVQGTERVTAGDLTTLVDVSGQNEITHLAEAFNRMVDAIREAREELAISEEKYRSIFDNAEIGIFQSTVDGRFLEINPAVANIFGYGSVEEMKASVKSIGKELYASPERRQEVINLARTSNGIVATESEFRRKNGDIMIANQIFRIVRDQDRNILYYEGFLEDITERKQAEAALRESEQRYQVLAESSPVGVFRTTVDGETIYVNSRWCKISGLSSREALGNGWMQVVHPEDREQVMAEWQRAAEEQRNSRVEYRFLRPDGEVVWVIGQAVTEKDSEGKVHGYVGTITDITERKRIEGELDRYREHLEELVETRTAELAIAKKQAEEADRLKSAFLATMSHELRTPLNSIIGFTGIILQGLVGPLNNEQAKQLGMVRGSARHLLDLINDVLDISKIEAGQLEVAQAPFDMHAEVEKTVQELVPLAEKKGLKLGASISPEVGQIVSDQRRVRQILVNLVNNAIKFTEKGEVRVECRVRNHWVETDVIDTGIGIKSEDMGKLFEPFRQIDTGIDRRREGTGLGLSICKKLLDMLNGKIRVESQWGIGSTFSFMLPLDGSGGR